MDPLIIDEKLLGVGNPVYVIAEIGINHNGDVNIARELIHVSWRAGCDAVKFQKRTPEICVPEDQKGIYRDTPWGRMTYLEYKKRIEFGREEYKILDEHCRTRGMTWFASPWDVPSVAFLKEMGVPCFKIASACLTDHELLHAVAETQKPVILSTGMSTIDEIDAAVEVLKGSPLALAQSTLTYPARLDHLNLRVIPSLRDRYRVPIGYSGHETGLPPTIAAVALGASFVERHVTLDRTMWGSDHSASLEPHGLETLVRHIRAVEQSLGDGVKRVYEEELPVREKLRRVT